MRGRACGRRSAVVHAIAIGRAVRISRSQGGSQGAAFTRGLVCAHERVHVDVALQLNEAQRHFTVSEGSDVTSDTP